jgi:hypothetical protein
MKPHHAIAVLAAALACAGARPRAREAAEPAEVLVEVLPRDAEVELDGRPVGRGGMTLPAPDASVPHVVRVSADGYVPDERALPRESLAGARIGAALRPDGLGGPPLDYDDAAGLAVAAAFLVSTGASRDAADYAERAVTLEPALPLAQRALGDAFGALGSPRRAAEAWSRYLQLAPDAPDAPDVARRLGQVRGEDASR